MSQANCPIDEFDDASGNYTQLVSVNGQQVSTLSTSSGHALGFGSSVECGAEDCGTIGAHSKSMMMLFKQIFY